MAILKIPFRVGTPAKRVDVFHMLCGLLFLFDPIQPRHESFDCFSLASLYLSPFFLAHLKGCFVNVATRNSYEKTKRNEGKER
jgi:hypothetical protein